MKKYIRFTERNDWEGETWHFYLEYNDPIDEKAAEMIDKKIKAGKNRSSYSIDLKKKYTENEVDNLVKTSRCGYMYFHNKVSRILPEFPKDWETKSADQLFYKGSCFEVEQ